LSVESVPPKPPGAVCRIVVCRSTLPQCNLLNSSPHGHRRFLRREQWSLISAVKPARDGGLSGESLLKEKAGGISVFARDNGARRQSHRRFRSRWPRPRLIHSAHKVDAHAAEVHTFGRERPLSSIGHCHVAERHIDVEVVTSPPAQQPLRQSVSLVGTRTDIKLMSSVVNAQQLQQKDGAHLLSSKGGRVVAAPSSGNCRLHPQFSPRTAITTQRYRAGVQVTAPSCVRVVSHKIMLFQCDSCWT
jgi:hypothetical protein